MKSVAVGDLNQTWKKVTQDRRGSRALEQLRRDGFNLTGLAPTSLRAGCSNWTDYFAALPFLSSKRAHSKTYPRSRLSKYWPLVREMRRLLGESFEPYAEVRIRTSKKVTYYGIAELRPKIEQSIDFLEGFLRWDWTIRKRNPRNITIALIRRQIRDQTGKPHDRELIAIIDAVYRAAGKEGFYMSSEALDRIERQEKVSRVAAAKKLNRIAK